MQYLGDFKPLIYINFSTKCRSDVLFLLYLYISVISKNYATVCLEKALLLQFQYENVEDEIK